MSKDTPGRRYGYRVEAFNPYSEEWMPFLINFTQPLDSAEFKTIAEGERYIEQLRRHPQYLAMIFPKVRILAFSEPEKKKMDEKMKTAREHDLKLIAQELAEYDTRPPKKT